MTLLARAAPVRMGVVALAVTWLGALVAPHAAAQAGPMLFGSPTFRLDPVSSGLAPGDFDRDGRMDLAVAIPSRDVVTIMVGQASGLLVEGPSFEVGHEPYDVVAADLDGDGLLDLATANSESNDASVILGAGDGSFGAHAEFPSVQSPYRIAAGDVDGDGDMDLALMSGSSLAGSPVGILANDGDGGFVETYDVQFGASQDITMGDFDGDGTSDVAVIDYVNDKVSVLLATGTGSVAYHGQYDTGNGPWTIASGDLDGDGLVDLVTADEQGDTVSVLFGAGGGSFPDREGYTIGPSPEPVVVGDFDGDGALDVAAASAEDGEVYVLLNVGGGQLEALPPLPVCYTPYRLAPADFDGDGALDLAAQYVNAFFSPFIWTTGIGLVYGRGDGTLRGFARTGGDMTTEAIAVADFDADGRDDYAVFGGSPNQVRIGLNRGAGAFDDSGFFAIQSSSSDAAIAGDLDGDGDQDLAIASDGTDKVVVLLGPGDGTFASQLLLPVGDQPLALVSADLDQDGLPDLVTANYAGDSISVLMGLGGGSFAPAVPLPVGDGPQSLAAGDFDGDGQIDLAVGCSLIQSVAILFGLGDGSFDPTHSAIDFGSSPASLVAGDFDEDGLTDLAAVIPATDEIVQMRSLGDGSFSVATTPVGGTVFKLATADVSGDGHLDLVFGALANHSIGVLIGSGDGSFALNSLYGASSQSNAFAFGDLLVDGRTDVAVAGAFYDSVYFLINESPSAWSQVGSGMVGTNGTPSLHGTGTLQAGSSDTLHVLGAKPGASAALVFGLTQALLPFKGGILVPAPQLVVPLLTGPTGAIHLPFHLPGNTPPGVPLHLQVWVVDALSLHGFAATNGLTGVTQ